LALLEVADLVVHYGKALALDGVSLRVEPGELVAVLGPNGAGKSTLLKAISRAVPSDGAIVFGGQSLAALPSHKVVAAGICHCPEGRRLFPELTVLKNLQLGAYLRNDRDGVAADLERVYHLFPVLSERRRQQASTLSGGEQQMVAIGRALMARPRLMLMDEPSMGLAPVFVDQVFDIIRTINGQGTTILVVEQNAAVALSIADRGYVLQNGRIVIADTAAALLRADAVRRAYLGEV
jgi:branched-chain amino acid transport system ATP-binding protein